VDVTINPVRDPAGQIGAYLGVGRDVTRELIMEAQMRQAQKMEAIGTLAGGIAHDFNNILGAIFGFTELAIEAVKDRADAQLYLFEILKASERARDLVTQILAFSRQTGEATKLMQPRHIVREALKLLRASLPSTIAIRESVISDAMVLGDPSQVHQVIMNLCTNAGYAMRDTGGVLDVSLHEVELDVKFISQCPNARAGRHVVLTVADTGPGIPPDIRDRIFDPFFTTKPKGEGTGLGLSVVHGIAKAMGGVVTVESERGKGTEFSVYMPVAQGDEILAAPERPQEINGGNERLLVVDDEQALMRIEKAMLEAMGYIVQGSTHSPSALEAFRRAPDSFDAVITDYTMPNVTGYELARKLKEIRGDIPIILCSGYLDPNMEKAVRAAGIDAFVRKPFSRKELAQALRLALDRRGPSPSAP
jgi:nitrogen-specific signal transduction histidine kinase/ActR/RegA family two-component response regulator